MNPACSGFKGASSLELPSKEPLLCREAGERGTGGRAGPGLEHGLCVLSATRGVLPSKDRASGFPPVPLETTQAVSVYYSARNNGITYASVAAGRERK